MVYLCKNINNMTKYNEIKGDLIKLALEKKFDVIAHGCNCFNTQGAGVAVVMAKNFNTDRFPMELVNRGDWSKLGNIEYKTFNLGTDDTPFNLKVVNCYTQYHYGHKFGIPFDIEAFTLCMRKMNKEFHGEHIGLPKIGAGLAGGNWDEIKIIIQKELKDCEVTIVLFE